MGGAVSRVQSLCQGVQCPGTEIQRKEILKDLCIYTLGYLEICTEELIFPKCSWWWPRNYRSHLEAANLEPNGHQIKSPESEG